ncbi:DUF4352 domain-containing protein [Enterococcus raffinosus]|uniref:DUF4352 domain-containing protein n=1 Tax=Enterococcus raffinosus TaxID=71452 RepID=UPI0021BE130F|nr:DUF4352 domain-containing protein [Enterococcus raffinosus]UXJ97051.1 DUF4352 domain-containing protein [Enterococcus raffinosus]
MKKVLLASIVIISMLGLVGCSGESDSSSEVQVSKASTSITDSSTKKIEKSTEAAVGKRSNPVPLDSTATFDTTYYSENSEDIPANISMTISNVIRGDEAMNYLTNANEFNEAAPEGKEWLLFDVTMKMNKGSQDDAYYVTPSFIPISSTGEEVSQDTYGTLADGEEFGNKDLYEGGTQTGKVALLVPTGDDTLVEFQDFNTGVFFKLQ